jgi:DNA-directed RNA polymerase subunit RPC12/RpoP
MSGRHHEQEERPCEYHPKVLMERVEDGIECPECQHKIWDVHENRAQFGEPTEPPECNCRECRNKNRIKV